MNNHTATVAFAVLCVVLVVLVADLIRTDTSILKLTPLGGTTTALTSGVRGF